MLKFVCKSFEKFDDAETFLNEEMPKWAGQGWKLKDVQYGVGQLYSPTEANTVHHFLITLEE